MHERTWHETAQDVDEGIRNKLVAFRQADMGGMTIIDWLPPGVVDAARDGFVPLEDLLGERSIVAEWPDEHRRALAETRAGRVELADDGVFWMVRSPWVGIPVQEVVRLMWPWVDEQAPRRHGRQSAEDAASRQTAVHDFLRLDRAAVKHLSQA